MSAVPNEQKQIFADRMNERPPKPEPHPTLSLQYYQPPAPQKPKPFDVAPYMPVGTQNIAFPPQFGYMYPFGMPPSFQLPPIIKNIQINTEGPSGHHERLFTIHEDAVPTRQFSPTSNTLGERLHLYQFVRSSILNNTDGADIGLDGKSQNSLLSFIKFADLNPYNSYKFSLNPYRGLPNGFLIYRSCYPIRHEQSSGTVSCAKDPMGINVRIYKLLEGSFLVNKLNPVKFHEFSEWREVAFYEYIREFILKKKVCPHFSALYGYFICEKTGIDFDKIELLKNNMGTKEATDDSVYIARPEMNDECTSSATINGGKIVSMSNTKIQVSTVGNQILEINPNAYLGKTLVLLTESPMYNVLGWASKTYHVRGNIKEMINRGTHTEKEWMNILFQIMVALYVMQVNKIFIRNFKLETNVFIKDLTLRGQITNYWKYKIDDMDFYVPNIGHLVMIDSNYQDLDVTKDFSMVQSFNKPTNIEYKIDGKFLGENCKVADKDIDGAVFEMFKNAFDVNFFGQEFVKAGGCKPPAEILTLMGNISTEIAGDKDKNIKKYITKYMRQYLHNRIGTYLREGEIANTRRDDTREFNKGQVIVYEEGYGAYKFIIYLETSNGNAKILTKTDPSDVDIIETIVPAHSLLNYSRAEPIMQTFKVNESNMNEDDLLETYIIKE
jgi:hypothetical protein